MSVVGWAKLLAHSSPRGHGAPEILPTRMDRAARLCPPYELVRSGTVAREFLRHATAAEVAAVFDRSLYLRSGEEFVCIGGPTIGNGPLTLIAARDLRPALLGLRPGQPAVVSKTAITIAPVTFALKACELWRPGAWPRATSLAALKETQDLIARRAAIEAPEEGLGRAISSKRETLIARAARGRIAQFEAWLRDAIDADDACPLPAPVQNLIGLGPGLTPSGDDFLIGALALLAAIGERKAHASLARALREVPPGLTSPLSRAFLRAAAGGHVGEKLHQAVSSILRANADAAIAAVRDVGHSSGWDMMAGSTSALKVTLVPQTRSSHTPRGGHSCELRVQKRH